MAVLIIPLGLGAVSRTLRHGRLMARLFDMPTTCFMLFSSTTKEHHTLYDGGGPSCLVYPILPSFFMVPGLWVAPYCNRFLPLVHYLLGMSRPVTEVVYDMSSFFFH